MVPSVKNKVYLYAINSCWSSKWNDGLKRHIHYAEICIFVHLLTLFPKRSLSSLYLRNSTLQACQTLDSPTIWSAVHGAECNSRRIRNGSASVTYSAYCTLHISTMPGPDCPDIVRSRPFTHVAHNKRLRTCGKHSVCFGEGWRQGRASRRLSVTQKDAAEITVFCLQNTEAAPVAKRSHHANSLAENPWDNYLLYCVYCPD